MIIAENKLAITFFDKEEGVLRSVYKGRVKIDLALEHLVHIVNFYKSNNVNGSIADLSQLHGSFSRVMGYLEDSYYAAAIKSGIRCQAYVVSEDLMINNLGVKLNNLATSFNLKSEVFTDKDEAEVWVKKMLVD